MKKTIITISTILMVGFFAASAYAWGWGGMYGNGYYNGMGYNTYNQSFNTATQSLRTSIAGDRAELNALMASGNPDPKRVRVLSEQISNSETELMKQSQIYNGSGAGMMGPGYGMGMMGMMGGMGGMGCW